MLLLIILAGLLAGQGIVWCADRLPARLPLGWRAPEGWPATLGWRAGGKLRLRSLAIIVVAAAGPVFLWLRYGPTWDMLAYAIYWIIFLLVTVIDLEHRLILNVVILPALVIAIAGALLTTTPGLRRALLGGATGFIFIFLIYLLGIVFGKVVARRRGRPLDEVAFGQGDVKLAAFIGLVTGLPGVVFALVIGIFLGGIVASGVLVWQMFVRRRYAAFTAIPYGPFLVAGGLVMLLYGAQIVAWYVGVYAP
jgi:leader peptidase (prepilin peptidase)/N-methyltransferase